MSEQNFFFWNMPSSRPADYYLGFDGGSVFIDFDNYGENKVCLRRISFDGYGCCDLGNEATPLNEDDSRDFKKIFKEHNIQQDLLLGIVKSAITLNKNKIWSEALEEYDLI